MNDAHTTPVESATFVSALAELRRVRVELDTILRVWARSVPRLVGSPRSIPALAQVLDAAAESGSLELPARSWDRSTTPPLPRWVTIPSARRPETQRRWVRYPWRAELGWVSSLPALSPKQFDALVAVNDWLRSGGADAAMVTARHRSVRLFGDEKRLDALSGTALFGPGRLSFDLLRCRPMPPPVAAAPIDGADGADVVVVENSDSYWTVLDALRGRPGPVRAVVFGNGTSFQSTASSLAVDVAGGGPVTGTAWYWGDLDPAGVRIAAASAAACSDVGVRLAPARGLWEAMAEAPLQSEGAVVWPSELATFAAVWFGDLWDRFAPVRDAAARVAQESVDPVAIASWAAAPTGPLSTSPVVPRARDT